jgi:hypothetical protein
MALVVDGPHVDRQTGAVGGGHGATIEERHPPFPPWTPHTFCSSDVKRPTGCLIDGEPLTRVRTRVAVSISPGLPVGRMSLMADLRVVVFVKGVSSGGNGFGRRGWTCRTRYAGAIEDGHHFVSTERG